MTSNTPQEMLKKVNNLDKAIKASKSFPLRDYFNEDIRKYIIFFSLC